MAGVDSVEIPRVIFEQLEEVRILGETNMLDYAAVQRIAHERDLHALVLWLEDQMVRRSYGARMPPNAPYVKGIFSGFVPVDEEEEDG